MCIKMVRPLRTGAVVQVRFDLPESSITVQATGEVAWADKKGEAGIRLVEVQAAVKRFYLRWLNERVPEEERAFFVNAAKSQEKPARVGLRAFRLFPSKESTPAAM